MELTYLQVVYFDIKKVKEGGCSMLKLQKLTEPNKT